MGSESQTRLQNNVDGVASANRLAAFERRSCILKIRYSIEPTCTMNMRAYPCNFCGGWHKARRDGA